MEFIVLLKEKHVNCVDDVNKILTWFLYNIYFFSQKIVTYFRLFIKNSDTHILLYILIDLSQYFSKQKLQKKNLYIITK